MNNFDNIPHNDEVNEEVTNYNLFPDAKGHFGVHGGLSLIHI